LTPHPKTMAEVKSIINRTLTEIVSHKTLVTSNPIPWNGFTTHSASTSSCQFSQSFVSQFLQ
jgi:hypothetical protein